MPLSSHRNLEKRCGRRCPCPLATTSCRPPDPHPHLVQADQGSVRGYHLTDWAERGASPAYRSIWRHYMSITHQAVRTKSFQSLPIDAPTPLGEWAGVISSVGRRPGIGLFAGRGRGAPRPGEQGREEAPPCAPHPEAASLPSGEGRPSRAGRARSPQRTCTRKFRDGALEIGSRAIRNALDAVSLSEADVDYIMCVTSTGFMVPGLSSLFVARARFRPQGQAGGRRGNGLQRRAEWAEPARAVGLGTTRAGWRSWSAVRSTRRATSSTTPCAPGSSTASSVTERRPW